MSDSLVSLSIHFQRNYAQLINLTTERSALAAQILELAMNRNGKSVETSTATSASESGAQLNRVAAKSPEIIVKDLSTARDSINMMKEILKQNVEQKNNAVNSKLSPEEIEKTKNLLQRDIAQYNQDIKLLSLLVGKEFTSQDIEKLATTNLGKISIRPPQPTRSMTHLRTSQPIPPFSQLPTSSTNIPSFRPLNDNESQFLKALDGITSTTTTTTTPLPTTARKAITQRPKSQEALIAAYLKQQGIGPTNQIPLDVSVRWLCVVYDFFTL